MDLTYGLSPDAYRVFSTWHKIVFWVLLAVLALMWVFDAGPNAWRACLVIPNVATPSLRNGPAVLDASPAAAPPAAQGGTPATATAPVAAATAQTATTTASAALVASAAAAGAPPVTPSASAKQSGSASTVAVVPPPPVARSSAETPGARVYFDIDRAGLPPNVSERLAEVVAHLKANPGAKVSLAGFHDPSGSHNYNVTLANNRARAVRGALEKAGIAPDRIQMNQPVETAGSGEPEEARRVEVHVVR